MTLLPWWRENNKYCFSAVQILKEDVEMRCLVAVWVTSHWWVQKKRSRFCFFFQMKWENIVLVALKDWRLDLPLHDTGMNFLPGSWVLAQIWKILEQNGGVPFQIWFTFTLASNQWLDKIRDTDQLMLLVSPFRNCDQWIPFVSLQSEHDPWPCCLFHQ